MGAPVDNNNLMLINKDLTYQTISAEGAHSTGVSNWKGWTCSTGIRNLYIDFDGNVFRGVCQEGGWMGNIFAVTGLARGQELTDGKWVTCSKDHCFCGADMSAPKVKNPEFIPMFFDQRVKMIDDINLIKQDRVEADVICSKENNLFKLVTWDIGRRCNFNCWYCSPNSHNTYEVHKNYDMLYNAYLNLIKNWIGRARAKFNITGGEPTVYKDYLPFIKKLKEDGHVVMTTTNGSNSVKYYAELAEYSDICFSIHLNYVKQFGIDKFINNIQAAVDTRIQSKQLGTAAQHHWIGVRIMLDPGNQELAEEFHKLCKERFDNIIISVDAVHITDAVEIGQLHEYSEKEVMWIKQAN
jgi:organic radical activating enzyme